ncbi:MULTISPECIES: host attachment family protein [unclassified Brevundimonas]|uniref:host attachment family protein n=1 Tax=unclassified Brevundimonas TaxID=2622653 RepID=UPI0025B8AABD|nr:MULTISPECIES: host attachment family protein [unclassified Brevundimonas]
MNLPTNALVAVVDGENLRLFRNTGTATDVQLKGIETPALEERVSGSAGRISSDANPDNDTQAEDGHAMSVAVALNGWALKNKFDKLVVIAAPKTMGELRKHWHKEVEGAIIGEITKTLTNASPEDIIKSIEAA